MGKAEDLRQQLLSNIKGYGDLNDRWSTFEECEEALDAYIRQYAAEARLEERNRVRTELTAVADLYSRHVDLTPISKMHDINNERKRELKTQLKEQAGA